MQEINKNFWRIFGFLILVVAGVNFSLAVTPDTSNYVFTTSTDGSLTDMTGSTNLLQNGGSTISLGDSAVSTVTQIGFDFFFMGNSAPTRFSEFAVNTEGVLRLGSTTPTINFNGMTAPLGQSNDLPVLAAYAQDLCLSTSGGKVHYIVKGTAPNRVLTIEWRNMFSGGFANPVQCGTADLTFQVRLYESAGIIEYVYGSMTETGSPGTAQIGFSSANSIGQIGTVDAQVAGNITYDGSTNSPVTNNFPPGEIASLHSTANGSRRVLRFTPIVPNTPSLLTFTNVQASSATLNWVDNSSDENGFVVFASSDGGTNYEFLTSVGQNTSSANVSGLNPNTNYFFKVFAVSESGLSSGSADGNQTTLPAGSFSTNGAGGNWSDPATWANNDVPTVDDNVFIGSGATVIIDTATLDANDISIDGTLEFSSAIDTILNANSVIVSNSGSFRSANSGNRTHTLNLRGNLINDGMLDFSTNADTSGVGIVFQGSNDAVFGGSGTTTDIQIISVNQITQGGLSRIVELNPANFSVRGSASSSNSFLTITNGTFRISGNFSGSHRTFTGNLTNRTAAFHLNNPNYTVAYDTELSLFGNVRVSAGTFAISGFGLSSSGKFVVEGGAVNIGTFSNFTDYEQSGGTYTACQGTLTFAFFSCFGMQSSPNSIFKMSGGTIIIQNNHQSSSGADFENSEAGTKITTGGTLQTSNAASGVARLYRIAGQIFNLVLDNSVNGHFTIVRTSVTGRGFSVTGNTEIKSGVVFQVGGTSNSTFVQRGANFINNGGLRTLENSNNVASFSFSSNTPQNYTGSGIAGTTTTPLSVFSISNPAGVTIDPVSPTIISRRVNLFTGTFINSNKIQISTTSSLSAVIQRGNGSAQTQPPGEFDVSPDFVIGTRGLEIFYANAGTIIETGNEIPTSRTVKRVLFDCPQGFTLTGGNLTISNASPAGSAQFENGIISTGANRLIIAANTTVTRTSGVVDGNLEMFYSSTGSKTFHVGTANGYSPVNANVTALGTNPSSLTIKANQIVHPNAPNAPSALKRFWNLTETGNLTATLIFNYLETDLPVGVPENTLELKRYTGIGSVFDTIPATIDTSANTIITTSGISDFSDWTMFSPLAPTAANVSISGKVIAGNRGLSRASVTVTDSDGIARTAMTNPFGNFKFNDLRTGESYVIAVRHKEYNFQPQVIFVAEDITGLVLQAETEGKK